MGHHERQQERKRLERLPEHERDEEEGVDRSRTVGAPPAAPGTPSIGGAIVGDPTPRSDPMSDEDERP
jgi:hypothetical protein